MLVWIIFLILKILVVFALLFFLMFFVAWLLCLGNLDFYEKQGVKVAPGARSFILGNLKEILFDLGKLQNNSPIPVKQMYLWLMDHRFGNGTPDSFLADKSTGCVAITMVGKVQLSISDPEMVQDLFTTKNKITDKTS